MEIKKETGNFTPWYHKWNDGNNPILWTIRITLLKLDNAGLMRLKIGQRFTFSNIWHSIWK